MTTKVATVASMYKTAELVSSTEHKKYSSDMIDKLLLNNGYNDRVLERIRKKEKSRKSNKQNEKHNANYTALKLPYINDVTTRKIKDSIKKVDCRLD